MVMWEDIAVVGLQVRVADADDTWQYFRNVKQGKVSISTFSQPQGWIGAKGILKDPFCFDADFFDISHRDARIMDPQHRLLLECVWQALEISGIKPKNVLGTVGVLASCSTNMVHWRALDDQLESNNTIGRYQNLLSNDRDFLASRIAHKLNLKGPAYTVQSGCSSSAVAVHQACRLLQCRECDIVVVGAASLSMPLFRGYKVVEGMIYSLSGNCRPFSSLADGTVEGMGVGAVVLKRLDRAVNDGDNVWAIIKGSAVNNDGDQKVHYTAPSVDQQIQCMQQALLSGDIAPDSIEYVEGHGTGTVLGDSIELTALQEVYGSVGAHRCYLGSVKANIGHLDCLSGLMGLAKATFCVCDGIIPPQPRVLPANELINPAESRLDVSEDPMRWSSAVRRAAVNSLGIGGTNSHIIVENASSACECLSERNGGYTFFTKHEFFSPGDENSVIISDDITDSFDAKRVVSELWQSVLGIGALPHSQDHFFEQGGNSLTSIELIDQINQRLKLSLSSVILFELPAYQNFLSHVMEKMNAGVKPSKSLEQRRLDEQYWEL